jgi:GntR family transcriptional regulator, transcriptional repressor for pyruvate dehydrogenase complex
MVGAGLDEELESRDPERDGGLVDRVMRDVGSRIREGRLAPGSPLPSEGAFAAELGVSRTVVREAFRSLAALKLIEVGAGRRARVGLVDASVLSTVVEHVVRSDQVSIQQIYDVRRTVEIRTAALAAMRRSDAEAKAIADLAAGMRADFADPERVMHHDIQFHEAVAQASRNPMFALLVGSFGVITRQTWRIGWTSRPDDAARMGMIGVHEAIAQAVLDRDPRAAERLMGEHFDGSVKALLTAGVN